MIATARLMLGQQHDIYTIAAIAAVLGKPRLLGMQWFFEPEIVEDDTFDSVGEDEECVTWKKWKRDYMPHLVDVVGTELAETIEEEIEFDYELTENEIDQRRAYERDIYRGRVLV
jgi:hypothetical protein